MASTAQGNATGQCTQIWSFWGIGIEPIYNTRWKRYENSRCFLKGKIEGTTGNKLLHLNIFRCKRKLHASVANLNRQEWKEHLANQNRSRVLQGKQNEVTCKQQDKKMESGKAFLGE